MMMRMMMSNTVPMPMYITVLSIGGLPWVYPLAARIAPGEADADEYPPTAEPSCNARTA